MVSEGVDIPRLRVGVYATAAKTAMIFRQIVGRFVRVGSGSGDRSWLFLPAEPVLRSHAAQVEDEIHRVLRRDRGDDEGWDEPEDQRPDRALRPRARLRPVAADVVPQMNLFGEPGDVAVQPMAAPAPAPAGLAEPSRRAGAGPAFERRRILRARAPQPRLRARPQPPLRPPRGEPVDQPKLGLRRVDEATIEQLERSCELLVSELARAADGPPQSSRS